MIIELSPTKKSSKKRADLLRLQTIFLMRKHGKKNREIAKTCGCSASTVSDVLNKYKHPNKLVWDKMSVHKKAKYVWEIQRSNIRSKKKKSKKMDNLKVTNYVYKRLIDDEWSPEMIEMSIKKDLGISLSADSIYRYIKLNRKDLVKYFYYRGKSRKQRVTHRRSSIKKKTRGKKKYIDQRGKKVESRREFGHWEGDLVVGPKDGSKYVILSLVERKTREKFFIRMPNRKAYTTLAHIRAFILSLPKGVVLSITLDNGVEFSELFMHELEKLYGIKIYYTETYSPQQKGSNEHANGRLRRKFPKGTDFYNVSKKELKIETEKLNNKPMKLLGGNTPRFVFDKEIEKIIKNHLKNAMAA